jgi:DNA-cytosine methyltransferase
MKGTYLMKLTEAQINLLFEKINSINLTIPKDKLWQLIGELSYDYEKSLDDQTKRSTGIYYTNLLLAEHMINEMFNIIPIEKLENLTFLEPCVGTGNFVFAYLKKIYELKLDPLKIKTILNNIYVSDIDLTAIEIFKKLMIKFCKIYFQIDLNYSYFEKRVSTGLMFNLNNEDISYIDIKNIYPEIMKKGGFDIIVTNPPYKNLRAEKNKHYNDNHYQKNKLIYEKISKIAKNHFKYGNNGVLNTYKLFVEEILCNYSNTNSVISILIPSTILTDKSCTALRKFMLDNHRIIAINSIRENEGFVNAQQSLCSLLIKKNEKTKFIKINTDFNKTTIGKYSIIDAKDIINSSTGYSIFTLNEAEYNILPKLKKYPTVKELPFIINKRGELDLTAHKKYITETKTKLKLLRGKNIDYYKIVLNKKQEYVKSNFIEKSAKAKFIKLPRIACQQISNMNKERRIKFAFIPENFVLGNSCNFMYVNENKYNFDIYALLGIMNSKIINWLFKLTSSNNHVNNYEIDMLPIPIKSKNIPKISSLVKEYLSSYDNKLLSKIEDLVNKSYNLNLDELIKNIGEKNIIKLHKTSSYQEYIRKFLDDLKCICNISEVNYSVIDDLLFGKMMTETFINSLNLNKDSFITEVIKKMIEKYQKLFNQIVLNHITFKLSDLDLEMVKTIPQGGNWKNIPEHIVAKSKRLTKITQTGGRTTLYGRIDYSKPSYTITTYFNRPGNGTYVHPIHNRVISVREAARFQSFKDDYYFVGNKSDLLKQVGNAVPPLMAYVIGKKIKEIIECNTSVDLFCGAGGMTLGFKEAGIKCLSGIDNNRSACLTMKVNNPEMNIICDDITLPKVKDKIVDTIKNKKIDLICGGPPCQGFSHAGKRFVDDPRNKLFRDYVDIVNRVKPKIIIMENVPGMLTLSKGKIYAEIISLFKSLNYNIEGKLLMASDYGVPQKRKRLIIIGIRDDIKVDPSSLFPDKITKENQISAYDAISDLESIKCNDNAIYSINKDTLSNYAKTMKGYISFEEFISMLKKTNFPKEETTSAEHKQLNLF